MEQANTASAFSLGLQSLEARHRPWYLATLTAIVCTIAFAVLTQLDPRTLSGVSVWSKPFKFSLSFVAFFGTLAWFAPLLGEDYFRKRPGTVLTGVTLVSAGLEMLYISMQAGLGEASHFNVSTGFHATMYSLMGLGAVLLVGVCLWMGVALLRQRGWRDPFVLAVSLGLILTFVLGGGLGGYLSSNGGHWVGGTASDAHSMPLFHWSRDGGDLRVAHFFGMHAMQILPLLALPVARNRAVADNGSGTGSGGGFGVAWVITAACGLSAFTLVTFVQAVNGQPFLG